MVSVLKRLTSDKSLDAGRLVTTWTRTNYKGLKRVSELKVVALQLCPERCWRVDGADVYISKGLR